MFSEGEPARNTLFVLSKGLAAPLGGGDELLLVDPPDDVTARFTVPERTASVYTGEAGSAAVARVATQPGGTAHLRIGDHLLDVYSQDSATVVHLPALGILCSGQFGSDRALPRLDQGSSGLPELDLLRFLARLVRERNVRLYIPSQGTVVSDRVQMMERLADDVAYIHGLRRVVPALTRDGQGLNAALALADTLLPAGRTHTTCRAINAANVQAMFLAENHIQN